MEFREWVTFDYFKIAIYVILLIVAVVGNSLVILIVRNNRGMQSAINYLLVNLAIADILISVWCMWAHLVNDLTHPWFVLGEVMCKMTGFVHSKFVLSVTFKFQYIMCMRIISLMES
jgi:hypothetical protein